MSKTTDQQPAIDPSLHRRVNAIFGDSKADNYYYKPQKMTEEALMDVSFSLKLFHFPIFSLQDDHQGTLAKLQFILQLAEYILKLATSRTSLLNESISLTTKYNTSQSRTKMDRLSHVDTVYKRAEQLTLYVKAMHFLSSAMCLAR